MGLPMNLALGGVEHVEDEVRRSCNCDHLLTSALS